MNINYNSLYDPYKKVYYSDIVGESILDAISGAKYPYKVGSQYENIFFKVRSTLHYKNNHAKYSGIPAGASITSQAFYESPEHYMTYHKVELSDDIITNWKKKQDDYKNKLL